MSHARSALVRGGLRVALAAGRAAGVAPLRLAPAPAPASASAAYVSVSPARALYCYTVTAICTGMVVCGEAYSTWRAVRADGAVVARSLLWYVIGLSDVALTALVVSAHGLRGAARIARLIAYLQQIDTINALNSIVPADAVSGAALSSVAAVRALLACGALLALFSHVFYSTLIVINNNDVSTLVSFVFVYAQAQCRAVVTLEYACLLSALSGALRGVLARCDRLETLLRLMKEDDDESYAEARTGVRDLKHSYLSLYRLMQRTSASAGPAVLALLVGNTYKMMSYIYVATSAYYSHVADGLIPETIIIIVLSMVWVLFELIKTTALIEPCHSASNAMCEWRVRAGALLRATRGRGALHDQLVSFQEFFDLKPVLFSPLDICPITRSLLAAIVGGCSTFLVIVRQFNLKDNGEHV